MATAAAPTKRPDRDPRGLDPTPDSICKHARRADASAEAGGGREAPPTEGRNGARRKGVAVPSGQIEPQRDWI